MRTLLAVLGALALPVSATAQAAPGPTPDQATVWYLRHAAWAVRLDNALLVFDYQESMQMEGATDRTPRDLAHGFVDPDEVRDLDVYVFVTHAHGDHYDPVIFGWQGKIEHLTYVIGWEDAPQSLCARFVGTKARCYAMGGQRATAELDDIRVYTINSHHNDIPEVAYLVRYGDWVVYANGDYMADYVADYAYLKTVADHIDLAFVAGLPGRRWPHLGRAVHLAREFAVPVLFAMHFRDRAMCEGFVAEVAADGVPARVECPAVAGQQFAVVKGRGGR